MRLTSSPWLHSPGSSIVPQRRGIPTASGDKYEGGASTLNLAAMLDEIPVSDLDVDGAEGIKADQEGVARLKARQAEEAARAAAKFQEDLAAGRLD